MKSDYEITEQSVIEDILREYPQCIEVFDKHGMSCRTCMGVSTDTLYDGSVMHDIDLKLLVAELRECSLHSKSG